VLRAIRCSEDVCRILVPWGALVLLPDSDIFIPVWELPDLFFFKKSGAGCAVEVPTGSILRVGKAPSAKYYLVDGELVELKGTRAKIIGLKRWGWHYIDPRTNEVVVTVLYENKAFIAVAKNLQVLKKRRAKNHHHIN